MLFWLIHLVWVVFGPTELGARLIGPLAGAATILLTARLAMALWPGDRARPGLSAWILATTGAFLFFGSATMFDALLGMSIVLAMLALWKLAVAPSVLSGAMFGAAIALGVLAKGPVVAVHILPVLLTLPFWKPADSTLTCRSVWKPLCIAALSASTLVSLWLIPAALLGGEEYRNAILWHQSAGRVASSFAHQRPFWFYAALLPLFFWPWGWGRELSSLRERPLTPPTRFLLVWAVGAFLSFSLISGKQIHYLIPELPALALLFSARLPKRSGPLFTCLALLPAAVLILGSIAVAHGRLEPAWLDGTRPAEFDIAQSCIILAMAVFLIFFARTRFEATVMTAPATLLIVHLLASKPVWQTNDTGPLGALLADVGKNGAATLDSSYAGQFTFSARLPEPVRVLHSREEYQLWRRTKPNGVLLARDSQVTENAGLLWMGVVHGDTWYVYRFETAD